MIRCPSCDATTRVTETRGRKRTRLCKRGHRFATVEHTVTSEPETPVVAVPKAAASMDGVDIDAVHERRTQRDLQAMFNAMVRS